MTGLGLFVGVVFWTLVWFRLRRRRRGDLPLGAGDHHGGDGPRWSMFRGGF